MTGPIGGLDGVTSELRDLATSLLTASAALSGLVLVFLGSLLNAYDQFTAPEQESIRASYRFRAWMGLCGFVLALVCGVLSVLATLYSETVWLVLATVCLWASLILLLVMAVRAVWEI